MANYDLPQAELFLFCIFVPFDFPRLPVANTVNFQKTINALKYKHVLHAVRYFWPVDYLM